MGLGLPNLPKRLVVSIVFGCISAFALYGYENQRTESLRKQYMTISIVTAKQDINENSVITGDMVETRDIPADLVVMDALKHSDEAIGKVARLDIIGGDQISTRKIGDSNDTQSRYLDIPEGMRAVTVTPDDNGYALSLVRAGDTVDLLVDYDDSETRRSLVLESIRIIRLNENKTDDENAPLYTATLVLPKDQSEIVTKADQFGTVRFLHRPTMEKNQGNKVITHRELQRTKPVNAGMGRQTAKPSTVGKASHKQPSPSVKPETSIEIIRGMVVENQTINSN